MFHEAPLATAIQLFSGSILSLLQWTDKLSRPLLQY